MTFPRMAPEIDRLKSYGHSTAYGYRMNGADYGSLCIMDGRLIVEGVTSVPAFTILAHKCSLKLSPDGIIHLRVDYDVDDALSWMIFRASAVDPSLKEFISACNQELSHRRIHDLLDHSAEMEPLPIRSPTSP